MTPGRWATAEALLGLAVMAAGIGMLSVPAAFIVTGAVILGFAILPPRRP